MLIADSSVLIDHLNGIDAYHVHAFRGAVADGFVGIGEIMLFEVLQGIKSDTEFDAVRESLQQLTVFRMVTEESVIHAAQNYRILRRRGITVRKSHDVFIATYCIRNDHTLLHNDRDFDPFEEHLGLKVHHP